MRRLSSLTLLVTAALVGCGDDAPSLPNPGTSEDSSGDGDGDGEGTETGSDQGDGDGDPGDGDPGDGDGDPGDGDGDPANVPPPSTGIQIVDVTIDQGIRIPIVDFGNAIPLNQQNAEIIKDRPALMRAFYLLEDGFEERTIYAVLSLVLDGQTYEIDTLQSAFSVPACEGEVQMDCRYSSTVGSFNFRIPAELVQPGLEYKIETFEAAPGNEDKPTAAIPHYPWDGSMDSIEVMDSYMKMRVVLVPVYHDVGGQCEPAPDVNEIYGTDYEGNELTAAEFMGLQLKAHNPVDEVEMIIHQPVSWGGSLTNGSLLQGLSQLRAQDNAPPEQYYYGVAIPCQGYPDFSGIAWLGGPYKNASSQRVAWGVWYDDKSNVAETFVHEIGHQQGREHIYCSGTEAGTDPNYPNNTGNTDSFGTHIFRSPVDTHPKTDHDYMTYCDSTWVSEWGWHLVFPWIETISSWELAGPSPDAGPTKQRLLFAYVDEAGEASWWTAQDYWDPSRAGARERVELVTRDGGGGEGAVLEAVDVLRVESEYGGPYMLVAPLPAKHERGVLRWVDGKGVRRTIDAATLGRPPLLTSVRP